jgi:hypothetical protein
MRQCSRSKRSLVGLSLRNVALGIYELEFVFRHVALLPRHVEPDVARQRLHALRVALDHPHPVGRQPRALPGEVRRYAGSALWVDCGH